MLTLSRASSQRPILIYEYFENNWCNQLVDDMSTYNEIEITFWNPPYKDCFNHSQNICKSKGGPWEPARLKITVHIPLRNPSSADISKFWLAFLPLAILKLVVQAMIYPKNEIKSRRN